MTRDEAVATGLGHLFPEIPVFRCTLCGRTSNRRRDEGHRCKAAQPDGKECLGWFQASPLG